jgi:AAA domain
MPTLSPQPQRVVVPGRSVKLEQLKSRLPAVQRAATPSVGSRWEPVDLRRVLDGSDLIERPSVLYRDDGVAMLYPRRINVFSGEPEALKTFLALDAAAQEIDKKNHVAYNDYEDTPNIAVERLRALGTRDNDILKYFSYFASPGPLVDDDAKVLLTKLVDEKGPVTLAIFDSVTGAMVASDLDPDNGSDVTSFYRDAPRRFADQGAAVLLIDHVAKATISRGRWAIGSERKLSGIDGASYTLKIVEPFGRGRTGKVQVVITKDRPGYVRQYQGQSHAIATFEPRSLEDGKIEARLLPPELAGEDGKFRPSGYMERGSIVLEVAADPLNATAVRKAVGGNYTHTETALQRLIEEGYVKSRPGPRGSTLYWSVKAFRKGTPPPAVFGPEDEEDFDDEPLTKSGTSTGSVRFPYKGGGTRNESNRKVPGTTRNRSGTTNAKENPEHNQPRRTPLAGVHRAPIGQKAQ